MSEGRLEVIAGCMFSGKSEELMRRLRRAQIARKRIQVFKPRIDNRNPSFHVSSHARREFVAAPFTDTSELLAKLHPETNVLGLDEVQFCAPEIMDAVEEILSKGIRVIAAGLDQDYRGVPFGPMPFLLAIADRVTKLTAICTVCGNDATRTQRIDPRGDHIVIGASEKYAARCREHHTVAPERFPAE